LDVLSKLPAGCAELVFADPPYNVGLDYPGYDDRRPHAEYLGRVDRWLAECRRLLSPSGSLWVQIDPRLAGQFQVRLDALDLHWENTVIWYYRFGPHQRRKFGRDHQQLLYYVADPRRRVFDADAVREPSDRQAKYGDKRANPKGRVPGDVWKFKRIAGTHRERVGHVCQTPLPLCERVVLACTTPGALVVEPFAGSGTACLAAALHGRRYLGVECDSTTAELARGRLRTGLSAVATVGGLAHGPQARRPATTGHQPARDQESAPREPDGPPGSCGLSPRAGREARRGPAPTRPEA
jgi:site-specific DNA-methyltransferase (adenine-specific)